MPAKYHIQNRPAPPRKKPIGKYGIVDWREECSACHNCVKRECAYDVYDQERDRLLGNIDYVDFLYECKGCLCCVQSCTKGLLSWQINPAYLRLGDEVWTADIISSTWYQAETGKIPVSGAGYPGPFKGPGFDSILTDMSEIVRPTRDGIHGREYISTQVDVGRKPMSLSFNSDGSLNTECPPVVELPLPVIFNMMPWHKLDDGLSRILLAAAEELGTLAITDDRTFFQSSSAIPHVTGKAPAQETESPRLVEWTDSAEGIQQIRDAKSANPNIVAMAVLPLGPGTGKRAVELAGMGVDAFHLVADWKGVVRGGNAEPAAPAPAAGYRSNDTHITQAVREVHQEFVRAGIRDEVTLIASGGISMAEHVIKTIICGADLVAIDVPLMVALECRVCMNCRSGLNCPIDLQSIDEDYAVQRIVNLIGAWHSQMLEMMGAMGIREVRRLRGEVGRAMWFDDLERDCFGPIFGKKLEVA